MLESLDRHSETPKSPSAHLLFRAVMGAVSGAIFGGVVLGFMLRGFKPFPWWPADRWQLAGYGAAIGAVFGAFRGWRVLMRRQAIRRLGEELSMRFFDKAPDQIAQRVKELLAKDSRVSLENLLYGSSQEVRMLVGELVIVQSGGDSESRTTRTMACFEMPGLALPRFTMQPEGMFLNAVTSLVGVEDIDFDQYPEFSRAYHLSADAPPLIRQLFDSSLIEFLSDRGGWEIRGAGDALLLVRRGRRLPPARLRAFFDEAREIFLKFCEAGLKRQTLDPPKRSDIEESPPPNTLRQLAAGSVIRDDEVAMFLKSPPPRDVPRNIFRQRVGPTWTGLVIGGFLMGFGLLFLTIGALIPKDNSVPLLIGGGIAMIGTVVIAIAYTARQRRIRLLRQGQVTSGVVESVQGTSVTVNNQQRYLARVRYEVLGQPRIGSVALYGGYVELARRAADAQEPIQVLYDPEQPDRILLDLQLTNAFPIRI